MVTTLRAALSVGLLIGFYVLALAIVGGLGVATVWLYQEHAGAAVVKLAYVTIAAAVGIVVVLWRVLRAKPEPPQGIDIGPDQAPQLWQVVRELAATAQTRVPDDIILVAPVNAGVTEDARLLGLLGGRRRMFLGAPLMQALTVSQMRSVLAHELGHYSRKHTRLGEIAYRGQLAVVATAYSAKGVISWILKGYARLYRLVTAAVSRRQELEADELSVQAAGRATAQSALRELPIIDAAWGFYETRYIDPGWEAGYAPLPADFFGGFTRLLAARTDELGALRLEAPPSEQSTWDSHPSPAVRIRAMEAMPDVVVRADDRPATDLVPMFDQACAALAAKVVAFGGRTQLPWDDFRAVATLIQEQRQADHIYRATARIVGGSEAGLGTLLDLIAAGRLHEVAAEFIPNATKRESAERFLPLMRLLLRVAAVRSNAARWQHSWSGSPTLVRADGQPLDVDDVSALAVSAPTLDAARRQLAAMGIDVAAAVQVDRVATVHGGEVIDALANVTFNGSPHDLVILDNGLILTPCPKSTDGGKQRLGAFISSAPVTELAKNNHFVPAEEIASAKIVKESPIRVELTMRDGTTLAIHEAWTGDRLTKQSATVLRQWVQPFLGSEVGAK